MTTSVAKAVAAMRKQTTAELRTRYAELFGETSRSNHRTWLVKRIAWRLQANAEGDLTERARQRAAELANDADLRLGPPRTAAEESAPQPTAVDESRDERIPPVGSTITRTYKKNRIDVLVREHGFEHDGQTYPTLSAVAKAITGSHCNGFLFFGLNGGQQ